MRDVDAKRRQCALWFSVYMGVFGLIKHDSLLGFFGFAVAGIVLGLFVAFCRRCDVKAKPKPAAPPPAPGPRGPKEALMQRINALASVLALFMFLVCCFGIVLISWWTTYSFIFHLFPPSNNLIVVLLPLNLSFLVLCGNVSFVRLMRTISADKYDTPTSALLLGRGGDRTYSRPTVVLHGVGLVHVELGHLDPRTGHGDVQGDGADADRGGARAGCVVYLLAHARRLLLQQFHHREGGLDRVLPVLRLDPADPVDPPTEAGRGAGDPVPAL